MSASLVGSEMCIRDSGPDMAAGGHGPQCPEPPQPCCCAPCPRRCGAPVSYTHLTLPTICSV
eukprot:11417482-Alexandrium_andersonii.AAC.1